MTGALPVERTVGIVGAGVMGAGIAQVAAAAGHPVLLWDARREAAGEALTKAARELGQRVDKGKLRAEEREAILARMRPCEELLAFADCALVVEAILEEPEAKRALFGQLERIVGADALLASNTSSLSITELGAALERPGRFAGWHFFNPATAMPLVEVVGGLDTSEDAMDALVETARAWGKTPVRARSTPGFIVNRCARPFYGEPLRFVEEGGADVATVDALFRGGGFRMGPFELIDLVGLDINLKVTRAMWEAYHGEPRYKPSLLVQERVTAGRLGRKAGRGFYDYGEQQRPEPPILPRVEPPKCIEVLGNLGPARELARLWREAGLEVIETHPRELPGGTLLFDGHQVDLTHGMPAWGKGADAVMFDLSLDYASCKHLAITSGDRVYAERAAGAFQCLGMEVSYVEDRPGLLMARTICMLINEAVEALLHGVASAEDIDLAMSMGLNFPGGPLAWADRLGSRYCTWVLRAMQKHFGDDRYRCALLLDRAASLEEGFHA